MIGERRLLIIILLVAGSLVSYLGIQLKFVLPKEQSNTTWMLAVGTLLFATSWIVLQNEKAYEWLDMRLQKIADWFHVMSWQILLIAISPVFMFLTVASSGFGEKMYIPILAIVSWLLGIALALVGSYIWGEEKLKISSLTVIWMVILIGIAFLFRGIATKNIPIFLNNDEGAAGISASGFVNGDWNNIFITSWYSFPSLFSFVQSIFIRIFVQITEALRLLSAIAGTLTVAAVYLCGKTMFGNRVGVFAAFCLSALHFHIHFSRLGLNNIWDGLWYTIMIGALWYGWEHNKRIGYLIAGIALGFSQYFYVSSRGLIGIMIACLIIALLIQRVKLYQSLPHLILMFAITTAIVFPLVWFFTHEPSQFLEPITRASFLRKIFNGPPRMIEGPVWKFAVKQLLIGMQAYTYTALQSYYKPETPILRPLYATFFYIGLIFLLLRNRDSRFVLLLLWLIAFALIGGLSESAPAAQRYVAAAPACALIVGYGLHKITDVFEGPLRKYSRIVAGLSYVILGFAMISDLYFYFIEYQWLDRVENLTSNGTIAQQLANRLYDEPDGTQVAFFTMPFLRYSSTPSIRYLAPQINGVDVPPPWKSFDKTLLNGKHIIFVFLPGRESEINMVMAEYPNGFLDSEKTWSDQTLFWMYDYTLK